MMSLRSDKNVGYRRILHEIRLEHLGSVVELFLLNLRPSLLLLYCLNALCDFSDSHPADPLDCNEGKTRTQRLARSGFGCSWCCVHIHYLAYYSCLCITG